MSDGQNKTLHPFFAKPTVSHQKQPSTTDAPPLTNDASAGADAVTSQPEQHPDHDAQEGRKPRPRAAKAKPQPQPSPESIEDQNTTRRKRRKLSLDKESHVGKQGSEDMPPQPSSPQSLPSSHPDNIRAPPTPEHTKQEPTTDNTPPKKMLKLGARGTLVSPVSKSGQPREGLQAKKPGKRGRPKKEKHLLVVLHYKPNKEVGHRVGRIMEGTERFDLPKLVPPTLPSKPKPSKPDVSKPTHPFFTGKPKDNAPKTAQTSGSTLQSIHAHLDHSPRRPSAVTPGKLRAQARDHSSRANDNSASFPQFGTSRDRHIVKQPGMVEAPFPPKGLAHVRGNFYYETRHQPREPPAILTNTSRKMKHKLPVIDLSGSALYRVEKSFNYRQKDEPRPDGFYDPPSSLRVPSRHLIPGSQIQTWISKELRSVPYQGYPQSSSAPPPTFVHPACRSLFDSISNTLTPFDEGRSETQAWAHKYSPNLATRVLQLGREATYLRDWMKALTISAVETSTSQASKPDKADRERKPKKKRRKKTEELDNFIVDDNELDNAPDELVQFGPNFMADSNRSQKPSLVRDTDFDDPSNRLKITNSVIISGPPGSGKTAMVHAAAKELGFEIFEINSGSRRSGKDVLDKIGDMLENHLVQNRSIDAGNMSADEDAGRLTDAFNKDLESGRQGTMTSFFTAKSKNVQPLKKKEHKQQPKADVNQIQKALSTSKPSRGQKQSLILLEEVDIMFDEDKNFWQTVFTLLKTSKRPVIMTCNDEDLVPTQAINFQALLRLSAPPVEIAVDYLLLMAAREGHLLQRDAVYTLYNSSGHDLRTSIAELQLWCQMGVGDPRGGLSWIFQRWPAGSGVDENGQPIRVVSEGTYQPGMGFFLGDAELSVNESRDEELFRELWETWNIDPREKLFSGFASSSLATQTPEDPQSRMTTLKQYSSFSDSLSDMDIFCRVGLPGEENIQIDPTQPELPEKTRMSFINGMALLQTPGIIDYSSLDTQLAVSCSHLSSKAFSIPGDTSTPQLLAQITGSHSPNHKPYAVTRADFSLAFDSIASMPTAAHFVGQPTLTYSTLDGPIRPVVTDVAPYIRSIAAYDLALQAHRAKLTDIMGSQGSTGGAGSKRARTTRAARSALEGGQRQLTRRERWFDPDLDLELVLRTAGDWPRVESAIAEAREHSPGSDIQMQDG